MMNNTYDWRQRFSIPSRLDEYKQFMTGYLYESYSENKPSPEYTSEMFVRRLLKLETPPIQMETGIILHSIIEKAKYGNIEKSIYYNNWKINFNLDITLDYPELREINIKTDIAGYPIFGKVDAINISTVHDLKFTSNFKPEKYMESYQWKVYLLMTNLNKFIYDVFSIHIKEQERIINVNDYNKLELYKYECMQNDVAECICDYWECLENLKPLIFKMAQENNIAL